MENREVIDNLVRPVQEIELLKLQGSYPDARVKGRVITTKVVGVTFEGRQEVLARMQQGDRVWLEMEPTNAYDRNAIKVSRENGEQIGYLNRQLAASIHPYFKAYGYPIRGRVTLLTGGSWGGYSLGCMISFKLPKQHQLNNHNNHNNLQFEDWDDWNI
jgi:hypothetical protein